MELTGEQYQTLAQICVYEWIRDNQHLYIGVSKNGIARPISHDVVNKVEPVLPCDIIRLTLFTDYKAALKHERLLIETKKPKYNITYNKQKLVKVVYEPNLPEFKTCARCKQAFKPKRPWQKICKRQKCKLTLQNGLSRCPVIARKPCFKALSS